MSWGRVLSSLSAVAAVGATAVLAVGMSGAATGPHGEADATPFVMPSASSAPWSTAVPDTPTTDPAATGSPAPTSAVASTPAVSSSPASAASAARRPSTPARVAPRPAARPAPQPVRQPVRRPAPRPVVTGQALPLTLSTGSATRVITVVAGSTSSTTAVLQAWDKAPGGGWLRHGSAVTAHVGADGLSTTPSETRSATPMGSFTLTQAFGYYGNPGTGLPYRRTTPADWWISQAGPLYNTLQHCTGSCGFTQGDPNEHLYYETPYYDYAVVIDYNTRNSPTGVRQGAGSAFFLHVTDGTPTAGCVAIPQATLVSIMQWLTPSANPRILIGVA